MPSNNLLPEPITVMGVNVTPFSDYPGACECVGELITARQKAYSVAINPEKIYRAGYDENLRGLLNRAEIAICDGIGAALAVRLLCGQRITRITGVALFFELVRTAAVKGWKVFMLGASPDSNRGAYDKLKSQYPELNIVDRIDGYFQDSAEVVQRINQSGADIVFVAMGSPKQEVWISENRDAIEAPFCMGVGGTFDVVSGKAKWAPAICRKTGTEWLYRLLREPKRWRRQLVLPKFALSVLKHKFAGGKK